VLRITMRLQRIGLIGMTAFGVFYGILQATAYKSAAGTTEASRAALGQQLETFGRSLTYLLPIPQRLDTIGGYMHWRVYGAVPLLFAFWAIMSASGATRGDEERGLIDEWVSAGAGPWRYIAARFGGFLIAAIVSVAATSAAIDVGAIAAGSALGTTAVVEQSLAVLAVTLACYAVVMVVAQFTTTRNAAAGLGGAVVAVLFFVNSFGRTVDSLKPIARVISPFYYYDRTNPLVPGGSFDFAGTLGVLVAAVLLTILAAWLLQTRDLGAPVVKRRAKDAPFTDRPSTNPLLSIPVIAAAYEQRGGILAWTVGSSLGAVYLASTGRPIVDTLVKGSSAFRNYLTVAGHGDPYVALTGYFWYGIFVTVLSIYAITQVSRWSADDNEGRLEMVLSAPVSRTRVVLERALTLLIDTIVIVAVSSIAFYIAAHAANINMPVVDVVQASVPLIPLALSFAAVGALLASRVPRATVAVLAAIAFLSYLLTELGPLLKLPDWVANLSVFSLYGNPLTSGIDWTGFSVMLAITIAGFGAGAILMRQREVGA